MVDTYEREAQPEDFRAAAKTVDARPIATEPPHPTEPVYAHRREGAQYETRVEPPVARRRFSLGATFLGWSVATFFSLLFLGVLIGAIGGTAANDYYFDEALSEGTVRAVATAGIVGYLVATFLAYLIGGYAAGRISLWDGARHGALTVVWMVLVGLLLFVLSAYANDVLNSYASIALPFSTADVTTATALWALGTLLAALLGGALGGRLGERYHDPERAGMFARRRIERGRPL